jgi:FkbM family methyltransferase
MNSKPTELRFKFYNNLKALDVSLNNIIDGGCHEGGWTERVKEIYPDANYHLIDAQDIFKDKLEKLGKFYCAALGQNNEERKFYFAKNKEKATGSSLYEENSNVLFDEKLINTQKLKDVVPDQTYDVIKLDIQGAELEVIEGSLDLFSKTKWVQLECPVYNNNKGAPLFEHYINYMANCNFKVFDIENVFVNVKLMGIDFIFINQSLPKVCSLENDLNYEDR